MVTKTDLKSLLKQGLTGWEIGKLVFMNSWEVDHNREGVLSDKEIATLKNSLKTRKDIDDYNNLIGLYQVADYISKQASVAMLGAALCAERVFGIGCMYFGDYLAASVARNAPMIVTEKQLQALKIKLKKKRSKRLICLSEVVCERAFWLSPQENRDEHITSWRWMEEKPEESDHYMKLAEEEIYGLIHAGKLKPKKLEIRADDESLDEDGDISLWELTEENTPEQQEELLQNYFTVEQLTKAGLPEWIEYREKFAPWLIDKEDWQGDAPTSIAVIQEPFIGGEIDKRGYYKPNLFAGVPRLANVRERAGITPETDPLMDVCEELASRIKEQLEYAFVRRQVLHELSRVVGVNTTEDIDNVMEAIVKPAVSRYNFFARDFPPELEKCIRDIDRPLEAWARAKPDILEVFEEIRNKPPEESSLAEIMDFARTFRQIPQIKLDKIKPPAKDLKDIRSWVSSRLGDGWWKPSPAMAEEEEE